MSHARAKLTMQCLQLLVERVLEGGWSVPMAAEAQGCSAATGYRWIRRFRTEGPAGLADRSSRPHRSPLRLRVLAEAGVGHRRTHPYRPQTNGRVVERFNLTLKWEWAYARPYVTNDSRTEALKLWLHDYNYHRPHMAHAGRPPITS